MCKHIHLICKYTQIDLTKESTIPNINFLAGDADNLVIECDDEKRALIGAVSKIRRDEENSLKEAKEKLILQLTGQINNLVSFEELKAVQKIEVPIKPTIDAIRNQKDINLGFPSTSRIPSNKKIIPQRKFFPTKKIKKERKSSKLQKPSSEEANMLATKVLIQK
ncbi:uncharacterized protein LOC126893150 [Diabrotica virgifera virgifera]|uniref:Uncharacterized protein n=1 Tax=Diabrotica virgifera virgifera TaxID=50390 RepID=A0ABM5L9E8_DIAVI|nr:uncharacterized protein LOC126893150 [Diabrotica virgifera virgifera]